MAIWPASLPQSLSIGYTESRQDGRVRTSVDGGPPKQRRRFTAVRRIFEEPGMLLTKAQRDTFETFYTTTLLEGSDAFDWVDPRDNSTTKSFRFVETPEFTGIVGGSGGVTLYRLRMRLEILP